MITITMLQEKGGVGKTTLATHIAAGLAVRGLRVCLIDADGQGHATAAFRQKLEPGLYNLLVREAGFQDVLRVIPPEAYEPPNQTARGALAVVPGNPETMLIPMAMSDTFAMTRRLEDLAPVFEVAIIDTSPTPSLLHGSILLASDALIFPTMLEYYSLKSLESVMAHQANFSKVRTDRDLPGIQTLGIVPNMVRAGTVEHSENLASLKKRYGSLVWDALPLRITWGEAAMQRQPVFRYAPGSDAAGEAWALTKRVGEALGYAIEA